MTNEEKKITKEYFTERTPNGKYTGRRYRVTTVKENGVTKMYVKWF